MKHYEAPSTGVISSDISKLEAEEINKLGKLWNQILHHVHNEYSKVVTKPVNQFYCHMSMMSINLQDKVNETNSGWKPTRAANKSDFEGVLNYRTSACLNLSEKTNEYQMNLLCVGWITKKHSIWLNIQIY